MATKLEKPLKRELMINDTPYMLTFSPEGVKIVPKGKRNGLEVTWKSMLAGGSSPGSSGSGIG